MYFLHSISAEYFLIYKFLFNNKGFAFYIAHFVMKYLLKIIVLYVISSHRKENLYLKIWSVCVRYSVISTSQILFDTNYSRASILLEYKAQITNSILHRTRTIYCNYKPKFTQFMQNECYLIKHLICCFICAKYKYKH